MIILVYMLYWYYSLFSQYELVIIAFTPEHTKLEGFAYAIIHFTSSRVSNAEVVLNQYAFLQGKTHMNWNDFGFTVTCSQQLFCNFTASWFWLGNLDDYEEHSVSQLTSPFVYLERDIWGFPCWFWKQLYPIYHEFLYGKCLHYTLIVIFSCSNFFCLLYSSSIP